MTSEQTASRDRVMTALSHRQPDRIPIDYWANDEVTARLIEHYQLPDREALLQHLQVDLRYVMGPSFSGQQFRVHDDGMVEDHWGVLRRPIMVDGTDRSGRAWSWSYRHVERSPLAGATSVKEIESYAGWPSADQWDYSGVPAELDRVRSNGWAIVSGGDRLDRTAQLKPAMYLRGTEQFLADLLLEPAIAECILERIVDYYLAYNERVFAAADGKIDIFFMGDDMGTQDSLWVSPAMYRKFFKDNFRRFNDLAHRYGIKTMYHSCGNVTALIPDLIDCGLDVLQSLQPAALDPAAIKREYGADLAFQGGIDIQHTMPNGTPDEIRAQVKKRSADLGEGGGYIFGTAHNLLPDVPTENLIALFEAYLEYGIYP